METPMIFYMLIFYLDILLNLFLGFNTVFCWVFRVSTHIIISSANSDSFPIRMVFISFSCVIALTRTSSTIINKCGKSEHFCLVSHLRGKAFSFSSLSMLAVAWLYMDIIMLRYILSMLKFWWFSSLKMLNHVKCFYVEIKMIVYFIVYLYIRLIDF